MKKLLIDRDNGLIVIAREMVPDAAEAMIIALGPRDADGRRGYVVGHTDADGGHMLSPTELCAYAELLRDIADTYDAQAEAPTDDTEVSER